MGSRQLFVAQALDIVVVNFIKGGVFVGGGFGFIKIWKIELGPLFLHLFFAFKSHRSFVWWRGFLFVHSHFSKDAGTIILTRIPVDGNEKLG